MALLLIQNRGECPEEAFTLMGASLSRSDDGLLGQFGSGAKLAICTLLRMGKRVIIYSGKTRMEFKCRTIEISDDIESQQKERVFVQYGGTSTRKEDLGWVVDMGAIDWKCNLDMAIREFAANAIDHTVKRGDDLKEARANRDLCVEIVPDGLRKAQKGFTRVYIESCEKCEEYVDALPRKFLQFSNQPLNQPIMPKINPLNKKVQVYLCGAFVCELKDSADSMFDYNFRKDQIAIDESRNLGEYAARAAIAKLYKDAPAVTLSKVFQALLDGVACLETGLDTYYIKPDWSGARDSQKTRWQDAWASCHADDAVICSGQSNVVEKYAKQKGYVLGSVSNSSWVECASQYGIKTITDVLDVDEREGRVTQPPTLEAEAAFVKASQFMADRDLLDTPCTVCGFTEEKSETEAYYRESVVYIRTDVFDNLESLCIEQLAKHNVRTNSARMTSDVLLLACVRSM